MTTKRIRSFICMLMVMLTIAVSVPTVAFAAHSPDLAAPANFRADQTTSTLTLNWDAVEYASGYRVYYKSAGKWYKCATVTGTNVTFKNLPSGTKYTLAVRTYYKCKCHPDKVTWSKDYSTIQTATAPKIPSKVTAKANTTALKLTWTASKGATGYVVYYYKVTSGWKELTNTTQTTCTFKNMIGGCKYQFAIRPYVKTADGTTIWGDYKIFTAAAAPKAPKLKASSPEKRTINVSWSKVYGADGYELYYKYNDGKYKLYKTYSDPQDLTFVNRFGGEYTFVVRAFSATDCGRIRSPYTPVTIKVNGPLPCGCEPICCTCN